MQKSLTTVALLSLALLAPQSGAAPREFDSIAAVVNGQVITRSEINDAIKHTREMIMISMPPGAERDKQLRTLREDALNSLIERELILAEFKKLGGVVKDEFIEEDIKKIIDGDRFKGDRSKFLSELTKTGMTLKRFKELRGKIIAVEMMRSRESGGVKIITPPQLEESYNKHIDQFREESFIRLRTLMIPKITADETLTADAQRELINTIRKKIVGGEEFAQMAKTYSEDGVADEGGDRGTIGEESIELRRDLKDAAFALKPGVVSPVIEDPYALWLLKVESKSYGKKRPLSDPEVMQACEKLALLDLRKASHERWIARLKKNASIRRFDSKGRPISNVSSQATTTKPETKPAPAPAVVSTTPPEPPEKKKGLFKKLFKKD